MVDVALSLWSNWRMNIRPVPISNHVNNIEGRTFGRLSVIRYIGICDGYSVWQCRCECGTICDFLGPQLTKGKTRSCGCLKREQFLARITKHGHATSRGASPEYNAWNNMLRRCQRKTHPQYHLYGGRGISVCERWMKFENFLSDIGNRPSQDHSIHRIDNDSGYYPENVKWATQSEQQNTKRTNRKISFNSKTQTITQWAIETGIDYVTLHFRLKRGWSINDALTTTTRKYKHAN